jgi:hypothetical protein
LLLKRVKSSASFTDYLNNTGFHQYWIQTPMYSTSKDFIQKKVNETGRVHRKRGSNVTTNNVLVEISSSHGSEYDVQNCLLGIPDDGGSTHL